MIDTKGKVGASLAIVFASVNIISVITVLTIFLRVYLDRLVVTIGSSDVEHIASMSEDTIKLVFLILSTAMVSSYVILNLLVMIFSSFYLVDGRYRKTSGIFNTITISPSSMLAGFLILISRDRDNIEKEI